jgi:hypothetical protein
MPVAPLRALQSRASGAARWVLVDPELASDCLSAYRAVRLMLFAAFALISSPLRAEKIANDDNGPRTVLEMNATAKPAAKQARLPHARHLDPRSKEPRLQFQVSRKQAMACQELVLAHAPPQRQIPYEPMWFSPLHNLSPPCDSQPFPAATFPSLCSSAFRPRVLDRLLSMSAFYFQGESYVR